MSAEKRRARDYLSIEAREIDPTVRSPSSHEIVAHAEVKNVFSHF
jgi:hypothetical protein